MKRVNALLMMLSDLGWSNVRVGEPEGIMNDVVRAIEQSFRELLCDKRYKSITVKDICERAHVSRKTFYTNFRDKEDIISYIFKRDIIQPLHHINAVFTCEEAKSMTSTIQTKIYRTIFEDREYYRNLVVSMKGRDDTFIRVATNAIYEFDCEVLNRIGFKGDEQHADYISYFYASSQAMLMQKWIFDNFSLSPDELSRLYFSMTLEFWRTVADYM